MLWAHLLLKYSLELNEKYFVIIGERGWIKSICLQRLNGFNELV